MRKIFDVAYIAIILLVLIVVDYRIWFVNQVVDSISVVLLTDAIIFMIAFLVSLVTELFRKNNKKKNKTK